MTRHPKQGRGRKWTVAELKAIPASWAGDTLSDGDGLSGEVRALGGGSVSVRWKYAFKWGGKVRWFQAGSWPSSSMEEIRARRDEARLLVKNGTNPVDQKEVSRIEAQQETEAVIAAAARAQSEILTVQDLFDKWIEDGVKRKDGNAEIRRAFQRDILPALGSKALQTLTEDDLRDALKVVIGRGAHRMGVQVGTDLKQMFYWAEKRQPWRRLLIDGNPAALVELEKLVPVGYDMNNERSRKLSDAEIGELWGRFKSMEEAYANAPAGMKYRVPRPLKKESQIAVWLCLSTLSRIGELLMAEWKHVNFQERTWFVPKENVKGSLADHTVHLSDFSIKQLRELHLLTGSSRWLFPASNAEEDCHVDVKSVSKQVGDRQERFKDRTVKLKGRRQDNTLVLGQGNSGDWTLHDLRRTGATLLQRLNTPPDVIDRCQNHVLAGSRVRRHYLQADYAEQTRDAWRRLGAYLQAIVERTGEGNGQCRVADHAAPDATADRRG